MNKHFIRKFACSNILAGILLATATLLPHAPANAQTIHAPVNSDIYLASAKDPHINCDMIQLAGGYLQAIAWDNGWTSYIQLQDFTGATTTITLSGAVTPDVVLADNMASPGTGYILGVVYHDPASGGAFLETYNITGAGLGSLSATFNYTYTLAANGGAFPHIDMFADKTIPINGLPSLHEFVASYQVVVAPGAYELYTINGQLDNTFTFSPTTLITSSTGDISGDVAASFDLSTGDKKAYFAVYNSGLDFAEVDCNTNALITYKTLSPNTYFPHIEAMNLYDPGISPYPWTILAPQYSSSVDIYMYNSIVTPGINCTALLPGGLDKRGVAVAAATGFMPGSYCNDNYVLGWFTDGYGYLTQSVDYPSGNINNPSDFYQANSGGISLIGGKMPFAMGTTSNSGKYLLTVWYDGSPTDNIYYKLTTDNYSYRPAGVQEALRQEQVKVYPVPAQDKLTITTDPDIRITDVVIYNMLGQTVLTEAIVSGQSQVNVSSLSSGIYNMEIHTGKGTLMKKIAIR